MDKYKSDLKTLIEKGEMLLNAIQYECFPDEVIKELESKKIVGKELDSLLKQFPSFETEYQNWYSESYLLIKQILFDRLPDFVKSYEKPKARKEITNSNYTIEDYLQGISVTIGYNKEKIVGPYAAISQFKQQLSILRSAERRFESSLFEIRLLVQADLFDSELDTAQELLKNKFSRAAGAVAGVVLEKHLEIVCQNHNLAINKKNPTINDFNDLIKQNNVIDIIIFRLIQYLGDLRNLCAHNKENEPSIEQVRDLIHGVMKITKTVF